MTPGGAPGYTVTTDPDRDDRTGCYTAAAVRGRDVRPRRRRRGAPAFDRALRDYDLAFTTTAGMHNITLSAFANNYVYWKYSSLASGVDASGDAARFADVRELLQHAGLPGIG